MRSLAQDLLRETVKRLKAAETPEQRIDAVILANFSDAQNEPENVSAWLAFWAEARTAPALWRIQKINERRLLSNLSHAFRQLLPAAEARAAAAGLAAMIEGLWLRSEEHTSELQSLMRISYAVFCLKKTTPQTTT